MGHRFREGWRHAVTGRDYSNDALSHLTWDNLGWRLGKLFGDTPDELVTSSRMVCPPAGSQTDLKVPTPGRALAGFSRARVWSHRKRIGTSRHAPSCDRAIERAGGSVQAGRTAAR
jgi:hypothetical protein